MLMKMAWKQTKTNKPQLQKPGSVLEGPTPDFAWGWEKTGNQPGFLVFTTLTGAP